jgi:hypothetical protein
VLTTREAKRTFGLVGSGAILGWIVGGLATRVAVGKFGTEVMLLATAASYIVCAGLVLVVWHYRPGSLHGERPAGGESGGGIIAALEVIAGSRYLKAIGAVILLSSLATTVEAWQFKAMAKAAIPDTDALAMFFGTFNVAAGGAALLLQLVLTGRVLRRAGIGLTLFIVPAALTITSIGVLATGTLLAANLLRASDQSALFHRQGTHRAVSLARAGLADLSVKSFIDTVVYCMGDWPGGLVVLVFATALRLEPRRPRGCCWCCLAVDGGRGRPVASMRRTCRTASSSTASTRARGSAPRSSGWPPTFFSTRLAGDTGEIVYAAWPVRDGPRPRHPPGGARPADAPGPGGPASGAGALVTRR